MWAWCPRSAPHPPSPRRPMTVSSANSQHPPRDVAPTASARLTHAIPGFRYHDAPGAIAWLVDVLGAVAGHVYPGPTPGTIGHAELWFGDACVMLGSVHDDGLPPRPGQGSTYLVARGREDVEALHARAVAAGAPILRAVHETPYGSRDFACADPEGNAWHIGTYVPGAPAPA